MTRRDKQKFLVFLGLAGLTTVLLATSLSRLVLRPGVPPPALEGGSLIVPGFTQPDPVTLPVFTFLVTLLGIVLCAYLLVVFFLWAVGIPWKRLLRNLPRVLLILAGAFGILMLFLLSGSPQEAPARPASPQAQAQAAPSLGQPPPFLIGLVGLCLAALAAFLVYTWLIARRKPGPKDRLGWEAEKARQNILAGRELKEIILRCYQQMSLILFQEGGIERQASLTPVEFERELVAAGFPQAPVHRLTRLFEIARYGNWVPGASAEQEAVESLQGIIQSLRERKALGHGP